MPTSSSSRYRLRDAYTMAVAAATGDNDQELRRQHIPVDGSLTWNSMAEGRGVLLDSASGEPLTLSPAAEPALGAVMTVPLIGEDRTRGAILAGRRIGRRPFAPADLDMAQSFANHAILALELSDARSNQERLAVLEDRDRIASDLHDHVIQRLFATGLTVQSAATMTSAPELQDRLIRSANELDETIRQIRYSIFELRENAEAASLRGTVLSILRQIGPLLAHAPEVKFSGPLDTLIDETLAADAGAVIREALTNVVRHAQAAQTSVAVHATPDQLTISVTDDGIGLPADPSYSGLANLRHRAERWGGELQLRRNIGSGTDLRWTVPLTTV